MKRSLGLLLLLVTSMGVCHAQNSESARKIAENAAAQWNAAFAGGRVEDILSLYADNALLLQPNGAVAKGSGQIRDFWQKLIGQGDYAMDLVDVRSQQDGTIVATVRFSDLKTLPNGGLHSMKYRYGGRVYSVLKQQPDGRWKAAVQRWGDDRNT